MSNGHGDEPFAMKEGRPDPARPLITPGTDPASAELLLILSTSERLRA